MVSNEQIIHELSMVAMLDVGLYLQSEYVR